MTLVVLLDNIPPGRTDGVTWVNWWLEESADGASGWALIDNGAVPPVADPRYPDPVDITSENGTAPALWYRVRFSDSNADFSEYSDAIKNVDLPYMPTLREVAAHIRNRTVERQTNRFLGTFTNKTRPSDTEAWEAIRLAIWDIIADTGNLDRPGISEDSHRAVRHLAALRAAMIIERSYYSEQIGTNKSPYPGLERDWERRLPKVVNAIAEDLVGEIEPTPDDEDATGGGTTPQTDQDHVVPSGSRVLTKSGTWVGSGLAADSFLPDQPDAVDWGTKF